MEGGKKYVIDKKWNKENGGKINLNKIHYINNGIDLEEYEINKNTYLIDDPDLSK